MDNFLEQIARAYLANEHDNLMEYCFVMPNKRSATFLSHHFAELSHAADNALIQPAIITISDLVSDNTPWVEASRIELLFLLYNVYRKTVIEAYGDTGTLDEQQRKSLEDAIDFDKFQYWGEILINDFNDVDKYLVNAEELFHNVKSVKEISSNYLTDEQIEVIRRYWNEEHIPAPARQFWNHTAHGGNQRVASGFIRLWQIMYPLYVNFREQLKAEGKCYPGMQYRYLADGLADGSIELPLKRYIFVGFNILSSSEHRIFATLQSQQKADFYWDYQSPTFLFKGNRATRFLKNYVKEFKPLYDICSEPIETYPEVNVIAVPSVMGQAKIVGKILSDIYPTEESAPFNDPKAHDIASLKTAIVLPDENLAIPILHSLPDSITNINVTMGYPMRRTPVASLLRNIISMQLRARKLRDQGTFFYEDLSNILTHPLLMRRFSEQCASILDHIRRKNLFNVPQSLLMAPEYSQLAPIFEIVSNHNDPDAVIRYLDNLLTLISTAMYDDDTLDEEKDRSLPLQDAFIRHYKAALDQLRMLSNRFLKPDAITMADSTTFRLAERILGSETAVLEGKPLRGLQIMGVLETRALDFDTIIMPSMNERIFPRKHYSRSFIPNALRNGYNMATLDHQESIFAYYFYRLISRASHVYLLYDGRSTGTRNGRPSRYIAQLKYIFNVPDMTVSHAGFDLISSDSAELLSLPKDEFVREVLSHFIAGSPEPRYLSASSINKYISCPLQFCLSEVYGFKEPDKVQNYIDESTMGRIVHQVFQELYDNERGPRPDVLITADTISRLDDDVILTRLIAKAIRQNYLHTDDESAPLPADCRITARVLLRMVRETLHKEQVPFRYIEGEMKLMGPLRISPDLSINFKQYIDRVDAITEEDGTEKIRLIDYKTGSDSITAKDFDALFTEKPSSSGYSQRCKAILQLFLYCNGYAQLQKSGPYPGPIQPIIYLLRKIFVQDISPLKFYDNQLLDYRDYNDEFLERMESVLEDMLLNDKPFTAAPDNKPCKYCQFVSLCNRDI